MRKALCALLLITALACADEPAWLTSTLYDDYGRQDRVPLPWTPLDYGFRSISAWGRTFVWSERSLLPASLTSGGVELLASSMRLVVTVAEHQATVPLRSFRFTRKAQSRGEMVARGSALGVDFEAAMWMEYDGFLWVTLRCAGGEEKTIDGLRVEAAVAPENARLYQAFARPLAGAIGSDPIRLPWYANRAENIVNFYHWIGNEDRGLGFTYTSLQHWAPQSEDSFCTIHGARGSVRYTINLIEKSVSLAGRAFLFGIQATPIKPLPPDYHSMFAATLHYEDWRAWAQVPENVDTLLIWPKDTGVMPGLNAPYAVKERQMREAVKYAHDRGIAFLGVAHCPQKFSAQSAEFEQYKQDWQVLPESVLDWDGVPQVQNCGRSYTLRKWLFYGWAVQNVQRFGLDGLYCDGWQAGTIACSNARHGCGWTDSEGKRQPTVPVLEGREFNQRLLLFLEDHVKSPYIPPPAAPAREGFPHYCFRIHSWEFVPSVMGFATQWLTGEFAGWPLHGPSMLTSEGSYGKCVGMDLVRARCLSTNWGVPNLFHAIMWEAEKDCPTDKQTLMAYAWLLPHGIPLGETTYMNQKAVVRITRTLLDFGVRRARFTPCWRPNPFWRIEAPLAEDAVVATWDHGLTGVLACVSNLHVADTRHMRLRWTGGYIPTLTNALTGERLAMQDNVLELNLGPESFLLLRAGVAGAG